MIRPLPSQMPSAGWRKEVRMRKNTSGADSLAPIQRGCVLNECGVLACVSPLCMRGGQTRKQRRPWQPAGEAWEGDVKRFLQPIQAIVAVQAQSARQERSLLVTVILIVLNQVMNVGATTGFAISGGSATLRGFLLWQIIGSVFGLGTQLTFAGLVRASSVKLAAAVGIGLAFVSAEVFSAYKIFNEPFTRLQWMGVALVGSGLLFIAWGKG
jgi:hypothetical protein